MRTPLLDRSECRVLLQPETLVPLLHQAFVSYSTLGARRAHRVRARLGDDGTSTVLFPGITPGIPAFTVKVHAKFPGQGPAIRGVLCLHDLESGSLLAIMDSTYLTAVRTGLTGALAAHRLANPQAGDVLVVGAGVPGAEILPSLASLRPLRRVRVYDTIPEVNPARFTVAPAQPRPDNGASATGWRTLRSTRRRCGFPPPPTRLASPR